MNGNRNPRADGPAPKPYAARPPGGAPSSTFTRRELACRPNVSTCTGADDELLTRKEISQLLKLSERTVARWMREGNVPHHKYGPKLVRFRWREVQRCFDERERDFQARLAASRKARP